MLRIDDCSVELIELETPVELASGMAMPGLAENVRTCDPLIVSAIEAVFWIAPLVPMIVIFWSPVAAVERALKVTMLLPAAEIDVGENETVRPGTDGEEERLMDPAKPPDGTPCRLTCTMLPAETDAAAGVTDNEKLALDETTSRNVVLLETVPLLPTTVTTYVPDAAEVAACTERVLEPRAVIVCGEKAYETPVIAGVADRTTLTEPPPAQLPVGLAPMLMVAPDPLATVSWEMLGVSVKPHTMLTVTTVDRTTKPLVPVTVTWYDPVEAAARA